MKKNAKTVLMILGVIALIIVSYFVGYKMAYDDFEYALSQSTFNPNTFYATIEEINEYNGVTSLLVKGLDVNDINYRGEFTLKIVEETVIEWRGTEKTVNDLEVGDIVSITYEGEVAETDPAKISDVIKIQILNDK